MKIILPFFVAYFGSKIIFSIFDFSYSLFNDPFDLFSFLVDILVFGILYLVSFYAIEIFNKKTHSED
ncbi:hypothetical protein JCM12856_31070 [Spirochaeta dissipatitropha]